MKRQWFLVLGILGLISSIALLAILGFSPSEPITATPVAVAFGSLLFALGGIDSPFPRFEWYHFAGMGQIIIGIAAGGTFLLPILTGASTAEANLQIVHGLAGTFTALLLMFIGFDWLQGGHYLDLSNYDTGPIWASE